VTSFTASRLLFLNSGERDLFCVAGQTATAIPVLNTPCESWLASDAFNTSVLVPS
jgi:hypothetical protein